MLEAVVAVAASTFPDHALLFGLDANVYELETKVLVIGVLLWVALFFLI